LMGVSMSGKQQLQDTTMQWVDFPGKTCIASSILMQMIKGT
jgi:hypothetical protein